MYIHNKTHNIIILYNTRIRVQHNNIIVLEKCS